MRDIREHTDHNGGRKEALHHKLAENARDRLLGRNHEHRPNLHVYIFIMKLWLSLYMLVCAWGRGGGGVVSLRVSGGPSGMQHRLEKEYCKHAVAAMKVR
jgi:hypothetical protein